MFTGLIEEIGIITELQKQESVCRYGIRGKKIFTDLRLGDSISVNGVCLTVSARNKLEFQADVMNETLFRSTMNSLKVGSRVNLERAMAVGDRFGGHIVTGHVDGTGIIAKRLRDGNAIRYVVQTEEEIDRFMDMVDPNYVHLLFDSGHLSFAGINPEKVMKKYVDRIRHIHLKDLRTKVVEEARAGKWSFLKGVRAGTFTVPGDGDVNFEPLFKILGEADYKGWVVVEAEQDPGVANPFEYALKARKYIAEKTGL